MKLPELLAQVNIEEETLTRLQQKLVDFLKCESHSLNHSILIFLPVLFSVSIIVGVIVLLTWIMQVSAEEPEYILPLSLRGIQSF